MTAPEANPPVQVPPRFRRIVVSTGVGVLPLFSALLTTLVLWRAIAASSSESEIGVFALCNQIAYYITFLQAGLDTAAVLSTSGFLARGEIQAAADQYHYLRRVNRRIALGLIVIVAAVSAICLAGKFPSPALSPLVAGFAWIIGSTHALTFLTRPLLVALTAEHRLIELSWVNVGQSLCRFVFGYAAYLAGAGIFSLALGEFAAQVAGWGVLRMLAVRHCVWIVLPVSGAGRPAGHWKQAAVISVGTVGWAIEAGSDVLLLQWLPGGLALVAVYTLWSRFPALAQVVTSQFNYNTTTPLRSAWAADPVVAAALFRRLFLTQLGLSAAAAVCLGIWLPAVMHFWLAGKYDIPEARGVAAALAAYLAIRSMLYLLYTACGATDSQRMGSLTIWFYLVIKLPLCLAVAWQYGMLGLLLAGLAAWFPAYGFISAGLIRKGVGSFRLFALGATVLGGIGFVPWVVHPWVQVEGLAELVVGIVATGATAGAVLLAWLLAVRVIRPSQLLRRR